jgi:hypothetical protein
MSENTNIWAEIANHIKGQVDGRDYAIETYDLDKSMALATRIVKTATSISYTEPYEKGLCVLGLAAAILMQAKGKKIPPEQATPDGDTEN